MLVVKKICNVVFLSVFIFGLSACSLTPSKDEGYKGVYSSKTSSSEPSLEVPPDLVAPDSNNAMSIPSLSDSGSSYSLYSNSASSSSSKVLPLSSSGVRFVRDGSVFWLEIKSKPDEIWGQARNFFKDLGFGFVRKQPVNGVMETNWLENRFDVPTGWFASMLGGLFSTGLMDKYRVRIERSDDDTSRLFITHQGLKEVSYGNWSEAEFSVKWQPRESDPELEAEMLQRFLVFRGVGKARAKQTVALGKSSERAKLIQDKSEKFYTVEVSEIFPRTWRRISIALDRMGLIVEDRNRSKGIYYIKTTEDFIKGDGKDKNWLASILSSSESTLKVATFQLSVDDVETKTIISIKNEAGEQDVSKTSNFILKKLHDYLR